jgi:hypothetical protein
MIVIVQKNETERVSSHTTEKLLSLCEAIFVNDATITYIPLYGKLTDVLQELNAVNVSFKCESDLLEDRLA